MHIMIDLKNTDLFTPYTHPESGVTSYLLAKKVAPLQQSFYFVNSGFTDDSRYLWFYCAFPPSGTAHRGRTLGVVDFEAGEVRHFPETQFGEASPFVDPATGEVYWQFERTIYARGPQPGDQVRRINAVPDELLGARPVLRETTHLTRSADGREFFVDVQAGLNILFGSLPVDGGPFRLWHRFDRLFNHAQFSPLDPDLVLFSQENHNDLITGLTFPITNRMWLIRRGEKPHPVFAKPTVVTHEWWDADGQHVWCVWGNEAMRVRLEDGSVERIALPRHCWHGHATADGRLFVYDSHEQGQFRRGVASSVHFLNCETGRSLAIADNPAGYDFGGRTYHIDPHPRFCAGDRYITHTTTVRGEVDVAITPVSDLLEKCMPATDG